MPELRTRTSSTYRNADGTRTAVVSLGSVHYRDGQSWLPLDSTIVPAVGRQDFAWQNAANAFHVFFRQLLSDNFLRLETQGHTVELSLQDANPLANAVPSGSSLSYANAFTGTDLRYTALPDGLKEEFVLASASAPDHYSFHLSVLAGGALAGERRG